MPVVFALVQPYIVRGFELTLRQKGSRRPMEERTVAEPGPGSWEALWQCLDDLREDARALRRLSQQEPLLQARPDYPRARIGRAHADEVRQVLNDVVRRLGDVRRLLPEVFAEVREPSAREAAPGGRPAGLAADESPQAIAARVEALVRTATSLEQEAFHPLPALPPHAPPYLAGSEPPGHEMAGTKAILLSLGIETIASALRNALLAIVNTRRGGPAGPC